MEKLTIQEEEVMIYIWELQCCFVKDIVAKYTQPTPPYTTVASIVKNLERKGYVTPKRVGNTYQYTPAIRENEYKRHFMSGVVRNYFENSYKEMVPEYYTRKQTLANAERYITPELKELEDMILGAEDKLYALEYELYSEVRDLIASQIERIQKTAKAVAALDAFASLALVAERNNYVRPKINEKGVIDIKEGRHPVVERMIPNEMFISNDTYLDDKKHRISIITGPNMAGKSTYMRQTALIVLMAQIGCFVPAETADIGIVDRIFTRVGASDDLASGQSTFMVEMTEVANILRNATGNSLLILDEIGRGTSTFDGLSIACSRRAYQQSKTLRC